MNPEKKIYAFSDSNKITVEIFTKLVNDINSKLNKTKSNYEKHIDFLVQKLKIHANEEKETYPNTFIVVSRLERMRVIYQALLDAKSVWKSMFMHSTIWQYKENQIVIDIIKDEYKVANELCSVSHNDNLALKTAAEALETVMYNLRLYYNVLCYCLVGQPEIGEKITKIQQSTTCQYSLFTHEKVDIFGDGYCYQASEDNSTIQITVIKRNHDIKVIQTYMYIIHQQIQESFTYPEFYKEHYLNPEYYLPPKEELI